MGKEVIHKKEMEINKAKLKIVITTKKEWNFKELWKRMVDAYGLDLEYKSFMALLQNNISWKLTYAQAICEMIDVSIDEIFDWVEIDVEEEKKKREERKKYDRQRRRKKILIPSS